MGKDPTYTFIALQGRAADAAKRFRAAISLPWGWHAAGTWVLVA